MFTHAITGSHKHELPPVTNHEQAKSLVTQVVEAHQTAIKSLAPVDMERILALPIGNLPVSMVAGLPAVKLINHHGQITYIQEMLGDTESHLIIQ